ncbi:MAG: FecR family protein [Deltaproteobacteria bacterium]|nr:FecR family protein [Deltaproteobacteria bacterium]
MFGHETWNRLTKWLLIPTLILTFIPVLFAQEDEVVATLMRMEGVVQVLQAKAPAPVKGRNGLLLKAGDTVITEKEARATIKFRDGSEIRLFPSTNFQVESKETGGGDRFFKMNLFMKAGSFWGNFVKQRQIAQVGSPTATIGIKGTTLRMVDRDGQARVALTEGLIEVKNDNTTVEVQPGKRLTTFTRTDDLTKKLTDIPYRLDLKSEKQKLEFAGGQPESVFVSVQLVDIKSGGAVTRPGLVYMRSNYDRITYPVKIALDQRGFARVALKIAPPEAADAALNGSVYVWAVIDQEDADDTSEGRILFKIPVQTGKERVKVDAKTGSGKKVK